MEAGWNAFRARLAVAPIVSTVVEPALSSGGRSFIPSGYGLVVLSISLHDSFHEAPEPRQETPDETSRLPG